jgi:hypothetical protein
MIRRRRKKLGKMRTDPAIDHEADDRLPHARERGIAQRGIRSSESKP